MANLLDLPGDSSYESSLVELVIRDGSESATVLLFTADATDVYTHYESDASARGFVTCLADECPICKIGGRASRQLLLPVYNLETRRVEILRLSPANGPKTLLSGLRAHLRSATMTSNVIAITRNGQSYEVRAHPIVEGIDRGTARISEFVELVKNGLDVASIIRNLSKAEIESIPRIRTKLMVLGHISPDPIVSDDLQGDDDTPF